MTGKYTCELCGQEARPDTLENHPIVPGEIIEQAGVQGPGTVKLCVNCRRELDRWYSKKVSSMTYDESRRGFREKTPPEMVREYETAYRLFARYKQGLKIGRRA